MDDITDGDLVSRAAGLDEESAVGGQPNKNALVPISGRERQISRGATLLKPRRGFTLVGPFQVISCQLIVVSQEFD